MKSFLDVLLSLIWRLFGVAILFGLIGLSFNIGFLGMFCIGFIVNYMAGTVFTYIYNDKHEKLLANENEKILEFAKSQCVKVNCAYCHKENTVPLILDTPVFKCSKCGEHNKLIFKFDTVQITTPVNTKDMTSTFIDMEGNQ